MGTDHHRVFDRWWDHAAEHYVSWNGDTAAGIDLYYDPIVDEHVGNGPMGLIVPSWYLAPQQRGVAEAGWTTLATLLGALGDGPIDGIDNLLAGPMLLWLAGEFAEQDVKAKIWAAADQVCEPTWDRDAGEFTLGFGLDEPHPRGQINARAMAGWVCTPGAWSRIFNSPNLSKFGEPTVTGVDFPRVAMSEARWDGSALHLAAHPQNSTIAGSRTSLRIENLDEAADAWSIERPDGQTETLRTRHGALDVELIVDNNINIIRAAP